MSLYRYINLILNKIEFSSKTKLLISIIAAGMISIGFLMFISIFAIKFDYETLFQKRTTPQVELEEIKDIYTVNIHNSLLDIKQNELSPKNAIEVIMLARQIISTQWANYKTSISKDIGGVPEFASNWLNFFLFIENLPEKKPLSKKYRQEDRRENAKYRYTN